MCKITNIEPRVATSKIPSQSLDACNKIDLTGDTFERMQLFTILNCNIFKLKKGYTLCRAEFDAKSNSLTLLTFCSLCIETINLVVHFNCSKN